MISVRIFKPDDMINLIDNGIRKIDLDVVTSFDILTALEYIQNLNKNFTKYPTIFSAYRGNICIGVYGAKFLWQNVVESFLFLAEDFNRTISEIKEFHKITKRFFKYLILIGIKRVQAIIDVVDNIQSVNWHKHYGFTIEGYLKKYTYNGHDSAIMSLIGEN